MTLDFAIQLLACLLIATGLILATIGIIGAVRVNRHAQDDDEQEKEIRRWFERGGK